MTIFWFRRDLRWHDNHALFKALSSSTNVVPIFIFDKQLLDKLPKNDARVTFIYERLQELIRQNVANISLYFGEPLEVFKELISNFKVEAVYTNHDYEPYAIKRDQDIAQWLSHNQISFYTFKDQVIFEKREVIKRDGHPYMVYTPYMKAWKALFNENMLKPLGSEALLFNISKTFVFERIQLAQMGFERSTQQIRPYTLDHQLVKTYEAKRNFPAVDGTSRLGPHLRFGTVSIREIMAKAIRVKNETFLNELIWREFFMQILWHFPKTVTHAFKPKYDHIKWRNVQMEFERWCQGKTGYPLVDAGMRELNKTGYMHNRVRMVVGSFLCKHLLIDWRWGEAYFAQKLHDYEMASNVGNWQWVAGCGVDAAPYFRIFNPTTQIEKFDRHRKYIKAWVPEYQELTYPKPIVGHKLARERCLKAYKIALN